MASRQNMTKKVKNANELSNIRRVVEITDRVFSKVINFIRPGQKEIEVAEEINRLATKYGSDKMAFPTIVASGVHSATPHHLTSNKKIKNNKMLLLDFGVNYKGYCSDLSRTLFIGRPDSKFKKIYYAVLQSQKAALRQVKEGNAGKEVHNSALNVLKNAGLADKFIHAVGHGIGLKVHESPKLYPKSRTKLKAGMVITIEPGVYIKGWGGVRIEDMVLVTKNGYEVLSKSSKNIIQI
jgi:Xaa-Pro aminopeptidase